MKLKIRRRKKHLLKEQDVLPNLNMQRELGMPAPIPTDDLSPGPPDEDAFGLNMKTDTLIQNIKLAQGGDVGAACDAYDGLGAYVHTEPYGRRKGMQKIVDEPILPHRGSLGGSFPPVVDTESGRPLAGLEVPLQKVSWALRNHFGKATIGQLHAEMKKLCTGETTETDPRLPPDAPVRKYDPIRDVAPAPKSRFSLPPHPEFKKRFPKGVVGEMNLIMENWRKYLDKKYE